MLPGRASAAHLSSECLLREYGKIFAYDPVASVSLALQGGVSDP